MTVVTVFIPASPEAEALLGIAPGSGIVSAGSADPEGAVRVDYEGGIYQQVGANDYHWRLMHAADRHLWNGGRGYPTTARQTVPSYLLRAVGEYDTDTNMFTALGAVDDAPGVEMAGPGVDNMELALAWARRWKAGQ
jgi:hypothetical protein